MIKPRAQGALEYLLLIGGGVLVATVILIIVLQTAPQGSLTLNTGINTYLNQVNLNAGTGSGGGGTDTSPPTSISLSATSGNGSVNLSYSASDPSIPISYRIAYDTTASGNITSGLNFNSPPGGVTIFVPTSSPHNRGGLTNGTSYSFILQACDNASPSPNCGVSSVQSATPSSSDTTPPTVSFSLTPGNKQVSISFAESGSPDPSQPVNYTVIYSTSQSAVDAVSNFDAINNPVFYVTSTTPNAILHDTPSPGTFIQTGLANGTTYYYRIESCDALNNCTQSTSSAAMPVSPTIVVSLSDVNQTIYDYSTQACSTAMNDWDFPDVYAHAVRNASNEIVLISGNSPRNYALFGTTFDNLVRDCTTPVLTATNRKHPDATAAQSYNNQEWVNMAYNDGTQIWGFVNNEFHDISPTGQSFGCSNSEYPGNPCWYNGITLARSNTGGHTFTQTNTGADAMIAPPLPWDAPSMINHPYGTMEPSNIIQDGGYYYMLFRSMHTPGTNNSGACVARTTNLADATSWMAWDGAGFNLTVRSPYVVSGQQPCTYVGYGLWGSLTHNTYLESFGFGKYMAVGILQVPTCGVYFSLSDDFITWSTPQLIKPIKSPGCGNNWTNANAYPSIIDHASSDQTNFTISGQTPYLYYMHSNANLDRDLMREQFTFTVV